MTWVSAFALFLLFVPTRTYSAESEAAPINVRESAVIQARAGNSKDALAVLKDLVDRYPNDARLLADATIVANWAGEDTYALALYARAETPKNDVGVVEAAARSARNLHRYDEAASLFARAEQLAPERWQARLGHAMVLVDEGNYDAAGALMKPLFENDGSEPDVERGQAYLCERRQDFSCAIAMYQKLAAGAPEKNDELQCQIAQALSRLGGNALAQNLCEPADRARKLQLLAVAGAERVRWSDSVDYDWQRRNSEGEDALTLLNNVVSSSKPGDAVWKQAQSDRLLALCNLYRMQDVVQSWESLHHSGIVISDYALARVASAYLDLHHPKEAEALYRTLAERTPGDGSLWSGLAFAEFENEQIQQAFETIDRARRNTPPWLLSKDLKIPQRNPLYASLALQAAELRGFADMPAEEQSRLQNLLAMAPANSELGRALAATFSARGWPTRAMKQEQLADRFDQMNDLPVLQDARILEGAGRRSEADTVLGPVLRREGNSPSVARFMKTRAIERGWQGSASSGYEWSNGQYIGNALHSEAGLYSPLLGLRWRAYLHSVGDSGQFVAGSTYRSRAAVGFSYDYSGRSFWGETGADASPFGLVPTGAVGAQFNLNDQWQLGAEGDWDNVTDVQLIGTLNDLRARSGNVSVQWRQSELRSVNATFTRMLYSDGNQRSEIAASWRQRALTRPRLQINVSPELWASQNSKDQNRIYFNPKYDASIGANAGVNWVTWRHYDHRLLQQFNFGAAPYWQDRYAFMGAASANYTLHWSLSRRLGLVGNIAWSSHPYDGSREPYTSVNFGLRWGDQ